MKTTSRMLVITKIERKISQACFWCGRRTMTCCSCAYAVVIYFCDKEGSQPSKVASSSTKSSRWRHHTVAKGIMQLLCCCNSCNGQQPKRRITAATMASCRHRLLVVWLDFNFAADVDGGMWFWRYCVGHNLIIFITLMLLLCAQPNSAPTSYQRNH